MKITIEKPKPVEITLEQMQRGQLGVYTRATGLPEPVPYKGHLFYCIESNSCRKTKQIIDLTDGYEVFGVWSKMYVKLVQPGQKVTLEIE